MRQLHCHVLAVLTLVLSAGCEHDLYEVLLQPRTTGLYRTLVCCRVDTDAQQQEVLKPMAQATLDRLAALYGVAATPTAAQRFTFAREFAERTPADVGGSGEYRCWHSSLGSLGVYAERFRGSEDQAAEVEKRLGAADRLTDLLDAWLQSRLGQTQGWATLHGFLTGELRRDLHNLALAAWAGQFAKEGGLATSAAADGAATARVLLFLAEHGYLLPQDLPAWGCPGASKSRCRATWPRWLPCSSAPWPGEAAWRWILRPSWACAGNWSRRR
jgi:hypothetical protein